VAECVATVVFVYYSAPMMLGQNTGDYVFTAGGLDNVITMVHYIMLHKLFKVDYC